MKPSKYTSPSSFILTCTLRKSKYIFPDLNYLLKTHFKNPLQKTSTSNWKRTREGSKPTPFQRARAKQKWTWTPPVTATTRERPGPPTWTFYCRSSASRSIWRTFGGSLIFVIGTEEVNANGPVKSDVFCWPAYYLLNGRQLNNLLRVQAR